MVRQTDDAGALFSRMWQFPAIEARRQSASGTRRTAVQHLARVFGPFVDDAASKMEPLADARHTVTFREIRLAPFLLRVERLPNVEGARTPPLAEIDRLPVSAATRKIAAAAVRALEAAGSTPME